MKTTDRQLQPAIDTTLDWLEQELGAIRTGRANPALVENIAVECYGSRSPLVQIASIQAPQPRLLVVQPWDPSLMKDIEKALNQSSLGITPVVDGKLIRLPFPLMTEERRKELLKVVHDKIEQARIRIRHAREETLKHTKTQETTGDLSEDEAATAAKDVQRLIDAANARVDDALKRKVAELTSI